MDDGPNTKVAPFWRAELSRPTGIPQVRYKDVSRRDLKALHINFHTLQPLLLTAQIGDRLWTKGLAEKTHQMRQHSKYILTRCRRDCQYRIGLCSHMHAEDTVESTLTRAQFHGLLRLTNSYYFCFKRLASLKAMAASLIVRILN